MNVAKFLMTWGMVFCYVIFNSVGALLIKHKIIQKGEVSYDSFGSVFQYFARLAVSYEVILGFAAIFLSALAWMLALSKMELAIAYPIAIGMNFLVILSISLIFHGEVLDWKQVFGIVFIMVGLFFMA